MRRVIASACAALAATTALAATARPSTAVRPDDRDATLRADADGPLRIHREGGVATFVGTPIGSTIDNPGVGRRTTVTVAARAHLDRYGDEIGADRPGTTLVEHDETVTPQGTGVVRYQQHVAGVPVLGGDVVVTLDENRELASLDAHLTNATGIATPTVTEAAARTTALERAGRGHVAGATAESLGRWLVDPATVPVDGLTSARTTWRFEVRAGNGIRRLVLVDDRTGTVLLDLDLIQDVDRVVCDQAEVLDPTPPPCASAGAARTESSPASALLDVNDAFAYAGATSAFYGEVLGEDLTELIGYGTSGAKKLAATVRVCVEDDLPGTAGCQYRNAFWDGRAMFYGTGYAAADDVVGHEMTHGVIERTSGLLYWDQPGAINEALADIIGEIIDHRRPAAGESASQFVIGEDLPTGILRSMANPPQYGDPDRIRSPYWYAGEGDSGGVHYNSGVASKAFFLISQGGTFNGQTIAGIDTDAGLTKSAKLWVRVITTIPAVAEYDDLATVLEQACASLQSTGDLAAADCAAVDKTVLATEMRLRPTAEPLRDVPPSCAAGSFRRDLLDSETGSGQAALFTAPAGGWTRLPAAGVLPNASSGATSWYAEDSESGGGVAVRSLQASGWVALPPGQASYLNFRHWHVFEYATTDAATNYWDGGTVELVRGGFDTTPLAGGSWQNGPVKSLKTGQVGFGGSSRGWYGSQVALTEYAGESVKPQFTMRYDDQYGAPGWYVDDILVYTCDPPLAPQVAPSLPAVAPHVGVGLTVDPPTWNLPGVVTTYQWLRGDQPIAGATQATYTPVAADLGTRLSVVVTGARGDQARSVTAAASANTALGLLTTTRTVRITGTPYVGRRLTAVRGTWGPRGITVAYRWLRDGRVIAGATRPSFVLRRVDKGHRIAVRITGRKPGYATVVRTSAAVLVRR